MLESTEKGGVRNSISNCLTVFQNDPLLSGAIAKNLLTERTDIIKPIGYHRTGTAITDTDMNYLLLYLEETYGLTSEKKIAAAIGIVANENGYHPIRDYLNGLSWDGTERIRTCLHHFLGADRDQYTYEAVSYTHLIALVQKKAIPNNKNRNLELAVQYIKEASCMGAEHLTMERAAGRLCTLAISHYGTPGKSVA